jgi:uncharacterized protein
MNMDDNVVRAATLHVAQSFLPLAEKKLWDEWLDLWAEDGVLDFPYAPEGRKRSYAGKTEILSYLKTVAGKMKIEEFRDFRLYPMLDPTMAVIEYGVDGLSNKSGKPFYQRYIAFLVTRAGKLSQYREYWNPLVSIDAHGENRDNWARNFGTQEAKPSQVD